MYPFFQIKAFSLFEFCAFVVQHGMVLVLDFTELVLRLCCRNNDVNAGLLRRGRCIVVVVVVVASGRIVRVVGWFSSEFVGVHRQGRQAASQLFVFPF